MLSIKSEIEPYSLSYLMEIFNENKSDIEEYLTVFTRTYSEEIIELNKELKEKDYNSISKRAHKIKYGVFQLNLFNTYDLCVFIEKEAKKNDLDPDEIQKAVHQISIVIKNTIKDILLGKR